MSRRITTPNDDETPLASWRSDDGMQVTRLPADPICPRVSLGGTEDMAYLVIRGDLQAITALLRRALAVMEAAL